jgi:hypothetical protein
MTTRIFVLMPLALLTCIHQAAAQATYTPYAFTTLAGSGPESRQAGKSNLTIIACLR